MQYIFPAEHNNEGGEGVHDYCTEILKVQSRNNAKQQYITLNEKKGAHAKYTHKTICAISIQRKKITLRVNETYTLRGINV